MKFFVKLVNWNNTSDIIEDEVEAYDAVKAAVIAEYAHPGYICSDAHII